MVEVYTAGIRYGGGHDIVINRGMCRLPPPPLPLPLSLPGTDSQAKYVVFSILHAAPVLCYPHLGRWQAPQYMYQMINWPLVFEGVILIMHTFVLYLFPFTFVITAYWFVFFKMQVRADGRYWSS